MPGFSRALRTFAAVSIRNGAHRAPKTVDVMKSATNINQMIQLARQGEPAAIENLLASNRNYLRMLAQVSLSLNLRARIDPSDVVQETLLKANEHFGQFRGQTEHELTAWLRRILSRIVVDIIRKHNATVRDVAGERSLESDESAGRLIRILQKSGSTPSQHAQRRETSVILADAIADMTPDHQQVIALRGFQELDWPDVAAQMNRSVGAVRMLWVRSLSDLRTRLDDAL